MVSYYIFCSGLFFQNEAPQKETRPQPSKQQSEPKKVYDQPKKPAEIKLNVRDYRVGTSSAISVAGTSRQHASDHPAATSLGNRLGDSSGTSRPAPKAKGETIFVS